MRTPSKIITAVALAGIAVAGGAAFTAPGLDNNVPEESAFIGGGVNQVITGAVLEDVDYTYTTPIGDEAVLTGVTLTFDSGTPEGSLATISFHFPTSTTWIQKEIVGGTVSWVDAAGTGGTDNTGADVVISAIDAQSGELTNMDVVVVSGTDPE